MSQAIIEGEAIVMRVPLAALPSAAEHAFSKSYGCETARIKDVPAYAKAFVDALNAENEIGDTLVTRMLDAAAIGAAADADLVEITTSFKVQQQAPRRDSAEQHDGTPSL